MATATSANSVDVDVRGCAEPGTAVTRSLLGYGVLAGPTYLVVGLAQALTRDGFDLRRHDLSLLANGTLGWIQIANLVVTGLATIAAAIGLSRALRGGRGGTWGPRLIGVYGTGLVAAGVFVADPMAGFPIGTPPGPPVAVSSHGILHVLSGAVGFLALVAACFVIARGFADRGQHPWAWYCRITGIVFLAGIAGISAGSGHPAAVLGLWIAVIAGWAWLSIVSAHLFATMAEVGSR
jgi:hypothetical protein